MPLLGLFSLGNPCPVSPSLLGVKCWRNEQIVWNLKDKFCSWEAQGDWVGILWKPLTFLKWGVAQVQRDWWRECRFAFEKPFECKKHWIRSPWKLLFHFTRWQKLKHSSNLGHRNQSHLNYRVSSNIFWEPYLLPVSTWNTWKPNRTLENKQQPVFTSCSSEPISLISFSVRRTKTWCTLNENRLCSRQDGQF